MAGHCTKFFSKQPPPIKLRIQKAIDQLKNEAKPGDAKDLSGELAGHCRMRKGPWRIVYRVDHAAKIITVVNIAHRSDAYSKRNKGKNTAKAPPAPPLPHAESQSTGQDPEPRSK